MSEVLIRGYKAKERIEEIIEAAEYGSNNCMIGSGLEIIELPEHGDLISKQTALAALYSDYAYAAMDIIEKEVPVIVPASEEAPDD